MAVPTLVGTGAATSGGPFTSTSVTPAMPTGMIAGDVVVGLVQWHNRNNQTGTAVGENSGGDWTAQSLDIFNQSGTFNDVQMAVYTAAYPVVAPTFQLLGGSASNSIYIVQLFAVRGADPGNPIDVLGVAAQTPAPATSISVPGVTTSGPDRFWVSWHGKAGAASGSGISGPGGAASLLGSLNAATYYASFRGGLASAGAVGPHTITIGGSSGVLFGKIFAISPVSAMPDQTFTPTYIPAGTTFYVPTFTNADDTVLTFPFLTATTTFYTPRFDVGFSPAFWTEGTDFFDATFTVTSGETGQVDQPVTLQRFAAEVFPPGTSVSIHEQHRAGIDRAPVGLALSHVTVDALGRFDVTGLSEGKFYVAYALVGGKHRYLRFRYELSPA